MGILRYFWVLCGTLMYFWVPEGTFGYFEVLLGTLRYFCVLWYREHLAPQKTADGTEKRKLNKIVELKDPDPSLTLSSIHGDRFGPVSKIIGLASSANKVEGPTLKELMKIRLIKRQNPVYESFDEFIAVRTSCHLVEEVDCEFLCDCRFGGAVWSSWRDILGNAGDIGNLQGVGEEDTEGSRQEESDEAISQEEEEEATEFDMDID